MRKLEHRYNGPHHPETFDSPLMYELLFDASRDILLCVRQQDGRILVANAAAEAAYGRSREQLRQLAIHDLEAAPAAPSADHDAQTGDPRQGPFFAARHRHRDGTTFPVEVSSQDAEIGGSRVRMLVIRDISACQHDAQSLRSSELRLQHAVAQEKAHIDERQKAEAQIRNSLDEKEALLLEIHHRVKNNMQVIIGLLNLQAAEIEDPEIVALLKKSSSRVNAMALIHNFLYRSRSLSEIDFGRYAKSLADSLMSIYRAPGVTLNVRSEGLRLNMDQAIPSGLILNELISNALKHAFPGGSRGEIEVATVSGNSDHFMLEVADNGIGLPAQVDISQCRTLGLKLTWGLATQQLGGEIEVNRSRGTRFTIRIPFHT